MPFEVFRRHQRKILAVLAIAAMIAFVFPLNTISSLLGFGNAGGQSDTPVAEMHGRPVYRQELAMWAQTRSLANQFVFSAELAVGSPVANLLAQLDLNAEAAERVLAGVPQVGPLRARQAVRETMHYFGGADEQSLLDAMILRHKADKMGVVVSDDGVTRFIQQITGDRLQPEQLTAIRTQRLQGVSEGHLYDILRDELRVRELASLFRVGSLGQPTPDELWAHFQRFNSKVDAEVVPVAAARYVDQVPEPSDQELDELFAKYKDREPDPNSPEPGFKQPRRVKGEELVASLDAFKAKVKVTEQEVRDFYERNKERYRSVGDEELPLPKLEQEEAGLLPAVQPEGDASGSGGKEAGQAKEAQAAAPEAGKKSGAEPTGEKAGSGSPGGKKDSGAATETKKAEPEPQYRPLDDKLAQEIRDDLQRDKAIRDILGRFDKIAAAMRDYGSKYVAADSKKSAADAKTLPPLDLKALAAAEGLNYVARPAFSRAEAESVPGIGAAHELEARSGGLRGDSFAKVVYSNTSTLVPLRLKDDRDNHYLFWKLDDEPSHVPDFGEVKDAVRLAFQMRGARELAKGKAEKIASFATAEGNKVETVRSRLVKAAGEGPKLAVLTTGLFSRMTQRYTFNPDQPFPFAQVSSEVPNVEGAGQEFMDKAFSLKPGQAGVAANASETVYYTIAVTQEQPAKPEEFFSRWMTVEMQYMQEQMAETADRWMEDQRKEAGFKAISMRGTGEEGAEGTAQR